jgi:serine phosphatase RsbU (regulator of sigma subunit)
MKKLLFIFSVVSFLLYNINIAYSQTTALQEIIEKARELKMSNPDSTIDLLSPFEKKVKKGKYQAELSADFYHLMGDAYYYKNKLRKSLKYYNKELQIREKTLSKKDLIRIYYNLGTILYKQKNYLKASNYFEKALHLTNEVKDNQILMQVYNALAKTYKHLAMYKKSLLYTEKYYKIRDKYYNISGNEQLPNGDELSLLKEKLKKAIIEKKQKEEALKETSHQLTKTVQEKQQLEEENTLKKEQIKRLKLLHNLQEKELQLKEAEAKRKEAEIREQKRKIMYITIIIIVFIAFSMFVTFLLFRLKKTNSIIKRNAVLIKEQHKKIRDSISYAKRIQEAVLPKNDVFSKIFKEFFVLYKPKDIVSGDFYWITQKGDYTYLLVADCTGHGVPGAFMSMLGIAFLTNIIVGSKTILTPAQILEELRKQIKKTLKGRDDGMDMALVRINRAKNELLFAGANNPVYIVENGKLTPLKPTHAPIGNYIKDLPFKDKEHTINSDTKIYMFSDGYIDQFGGENGEKFMKKRFKKLILDISEKKMDLQHEILETELNNWMKGYKQIDDITVVGIKLN